MTVRSSVVVAWGIAAFVMLHAELAQAHSGPPFPIVADQSFGAYQVAIWTDPDSTDDGSAAGKFWITIRPVRQGESVPADTSAIVSIAPTDRPGVTLTGPAVSIDRDPSRRFVALLMDHEGPYRVRLAIDGPRGHVDIDTAVDATYDLRPARWLIAVFLVPFLLVGFLWVKLLLRRRHSTS